MPTRRQVTISNIVPNLRGRWGNDVAHLSDDKLAELYEDFSLSDDCGNNDEKFPEWFKDATND